MFDELSFQAGGLILRHVKKFPGLCFIQTNRFRQIRSDVDLDQKNKQSCLKKKSCFGNFTDVRLQIFVCR